MPNYNKVILVGHLTRDPQVKYTSGRTAVAEVGLAVSRKWYNKQTQQQEQETAFVDITFWGKTAETAGQYLNKGRPLLVEGYLKLDQWNDKQTGEKRSKLKVIGETMQFLGDNRGGQGQQNQQQGNQSWNQDSFYDQVPDDEEPF